MSSHDDGAHETTKWICLDNHNDAIRLLYPSPVCFLSVVDNAGRDHAHDDNQKASSRKCNVMVISWITTIPANTKTTSTADDANDAGIGNHGLVLLSMNTRRHTASILHRNKNFSLSVPVQGMQDLIWNVGSASGRHGSSKFASDHSVNSCPRNTAGIADTRNSSHVSSPPPPPLSKRAKKRLKLQAKRDHTGIPNLKRIRLGHSTSASVDADGNNNKDKDSVFAIDGTVAHLHLEVVFMEETPQRIDDDEHIFMVAKIKHAFVLDSYWNNDTKIFAPRPPSPPRHQAYPSPPCLTFFGSQSFGTIAAGPKIPAATPPSTVLGDNSSMGKTKSNNSTPKHWISLPESKQWSRLLYTNPVCILTLPSSTTESTTATPSSSFDGCRRSGDCHGSHSVISRLTATNNTGAFIFGIRQNHLLVHTLGSSSTFCLSVPVQGMEEWIQQIRNPNVNLNHNHTADNNHEDATDAMLSLRTITKETQCIENVNDPQVADTDSIQQHCCCLEAGCVAHLECQVTSIWPLSTLIASQGSCNNDNNIDDDADNNAFVVFAKVNHASVHPLYWDGAKNRFRPPTNKGGVPLYLKDLGDGRLGYVQSIE